jgi:hypothetical protein
VTPRYADPCGHACCPAADDEPHEHPVEAERCADCADLLTPKPLTTGQALEAKARRIAEKKHTRRDP